jgi:hypothetical protein
MSAPSASISSLLVVSISTLPSVSDLKVLIPTFISVGFIFDFNKPLIISGVWSSFDFTVSLYLL